MSSNQYMAGRKKYRRPQALLFSENYGTNNAGFHIPIGYEIGANTESVTDETLLDQFIVLSDDNRDPIDVSINRIENRERMINGRMRSHHIADKRSFSISWKNLPSRSFANDPNFDITTGKSTLNISGDPSAADNFYTTDGGAGGVELLDWYNNHNGSFWVFLAYDNYKNFVGTNSVYNRLGIYNEVIEMFITDFSYSIVKRRADSHDLWDVSITLEEA